MVEKGGGKSSNGMDGNRKRKEVSKNCESIMRSNRKEVAGKAGYDCATRKNGEEREDVSES